MADGAFHCSICPTHYEWSVRLHGLAELYCFILKILLFLVPGAGTDAVSAAVDIVIDRVGQRTKDAAQYRIEYLLFKTFSEQATSAKERNKPPLSERRISDLG